MIADVDVLLFSLQEWEREGMVRYYHNTWGKWLSAEQYQDYKEKYGTEIWDYRDGIKIYFDCDGILHIDNCRDPELKEFLERRMKRWYGWIYHQYLEQFMRPVDVKGLIEPYTTMIKPGFFQIRCGNRFANYDEKQMNIIRKKKIKYDRCNHRYVIDTGFPRLDPVLEAITRNLK